MILFDHAAATLKKALATDSTAASFASKVPTTTEPTGAGVLDLGTSDRQFKRLLLIPFGGDAANETFVLRVIGWKATPNGLWVPTILAQIAVTLGNIAGVDGSDVENELFFADTLVVTTPASSTRAQATSPATDSVADVGAHALVDLDGFNKIELTFDRNSSAASCNSLYALV